ncbi:MAG: phosphofructokinase [Pseudonocardiales bacterium]|nr:phosphofructokinase [Pseudonocardiales bacterium]
MIVTVTPNPSVDRAMSVDTFTLGGVNRVNSVRVDPGGKGVNVSRALVANGTRSVAVLPLGGPDGQLLAQLLTEAGVEYEAVPVRDSTRTNLSVLDPSGRTTKINEPGPTLTAQNRDELVRITHDLISRDGASALVISGSLPPGLDESFFLDLINAAHELGVMVAVDTSGPTLLVAADAGADLLKPNDEELAEIVGRPLTTIGEVIAAAQEVRPPHAQIVVSLGARGALLVDGHGAVMAHAVCPAPLSTVGAGDSLLAGFLHAGTRDAAALATGVSWGTAAVGLPGSQMPAPADVARINVTLSEPSLSGLLASP